MSSSLRRIFVAALGFLLPCVLVLSACSDDPILGPSDDSGDGGSYSVIERLAQPDTAATDSTEVAPSPTNPERF